MLLAKTFTEDAINRALEDWAVLEGSLSRVIRDHQQMAAVLNPRKAAIVSCWLALRSQPNTASRSSPATTRSWHGKCRPCSARQQRSPLPPSSQSCGLRGSRAH